MIHRTLMLGLLVTAGVTGALCARAADMPSLFPTAAYPDEVPPPQMEYGTGWYLRGDLTATNDTVPTMLGTLANASVGHDWNFGAGGGVGYKFTDYFRTDVTGDYLGTEQRSGSAIVTDPNTATNYSVASRASLDRWTALVNGYVDVGNWGGLTPYIGAGIGVAGLSTSGSATVSLANVPGPAVRQRISARDDYQFAWAAMAGVAYHISPHLMLDLGYRYLDLGAYRAPQGATVQVGQSRVNFYNNNKTELTSHEVRVGVRYQID